MTTTLSTPTAKPRNLGARALASGVCAFAMSACSAIQAPSMPRLGAAEVTPVLTEHSMGLQCLGALIDGSNMAPIVIGVGDIRDRTIPARFNDRTRLSQAGEWLVVTAISKMETDKVRSALEEEVEERKIKTNFTLSGAWTQDDELLRQSAGIADLGWLTGRLGLSGSRRFDYVAGDFTSSRNGVVEYSTAIGVFLGANQVRASLLVEDGVNFAEIGFDARWADGPQLAQRRIAEAATLIHVANALKIDFRPCLESGWGDPVAFRDALEDYERMSQVDRDRAFQADLLRVGLDPGAVDGRWGAKSSTALQTWQSRKGLPVTGKPSPAVYALLRSEVARNTVVSAPAAAAPAPISYRTLSAG